MRRIEDRMNETEHRMRWWRLVAGMVLVGIVVLSLGPDVNPRSEIMDRLSHVVAYVVLTSIVLLARDLRRPRRWPSGLAIAVGLVALGAAMELAQAAVHRDASVLDGLADAAGVAVGLVVYSVVEIIHVRRRRSMTSRVEPRLERHSAPGRTHS